jgi:integrase/recombinase XerC
MRAINIKTKFPENHWLEMFKQHLITRDLSPATVRGYLYDLNHFHTWLSEFSNSETSFENVVAVDIAAYRQYMSEVKRMKAASVNRRIQAVKKMFSWAMELGMVKQNPATNIRFIKPAVRYRPKALRQKELYALLRTAGRSSHGMAARNYALIQLLVQTGLRIGEAAALKIADITLRERSGHVWVRDAKGRKERQVPLNAAARRALAGYLNAGNTRQADEFVFLSKRKQPASIRTLQSALTRLSRKANIKRIRVSAHCLRHTFAINYLKTHPGKLVELADLMGHESLDTVAIYTRPSQKTLEMDLEQSPINVY